MNPIAEEMSSYFGISQMSDEEFLEHYGIKRRSGRYPWGSGKEPYQHTMDFLGRIEELQGKGWKETPENIRKEFNMSTTEYKNEKRLCKNERQIYRIQTAKRMSDKEGMNNSDIARHFNVNESVVRSWFSQDEKGKIYQVQETAKVLKDFLDKEGNTMVDVGKNVELQLGVSRNRLDTALRSLEREGYHVYGGRISNDLNRNQQTTQLVLAKPGVPYKDSFDYKNVKTLNEFTSTNGGDSFEKRFTYPKSLDSRRLGIRYAEQNGTLKDGIVELRRGVQDLDLGEGKKYAQVRILVDGTHYIKGMAVYSDNMPPGIDVVFNTNKSRAKCPNKLDVLKPIKEDKENPFGSAIKDAELGGQYWYTDKKTGKKELGLINKRADQGDWTEWKDTLPAQFLSKQSTFMAEKQLNLMKENKMDEFKDIMALNNPTVKKYYLEKFASECDAAAIDLKAAALPGQKYHVIIPNNTLRDDEIYAPRIC